MCSAGMRKGNSPENEGGFTLLEILVALSVAAIALAVLVQGLSHYVNQFIYLKEKAIAQSIATSELAHKSLDYEYVMPEYIKRDGTEWELRYEENEYAFRDLKGLKEINLSVYSAQGRRIFTASSLVHVPEE